jgi:hypothetical protein
MKTNRSIAWGNASDDHYNAVASAVWTPLPKMTYTALWTSTPTTRVSASPENRVVSLISPLATEEGLNLSGPAFDQARFGFAGPDDRLMSINIPAEGEDQEDGTSFELEFDPEQPDRVFFSMMGLDEDGFIHTIRRSIPFPARLLAELLSRRKATAEEVKGWQSADEDE